ncbi:ribose-5-phosphate isomerase A [Paenibacillus marchantiophytorum]|uniref:Ribose-5-phosphate isomerase A n=1 Tax=Paenibacillus marchantiophytorum TaxID=1619310 RepID=A0ABQ1F9W2_9BACL|nr:ribose-5-phosphate isomerase RpiA [Paenibacillus marchantiophytorum]GGA03169.1 ribose-5-phosphate isomerase A [Paenibacillus marchantiophytorum]
MDKKKLAGEQAATYIEEGMILGLGTGSTVYWTIQKLGELVKQGLKIKGIPTSKATEHLARELGIPILDISEVQEIDLTIDGADEVNPDFALIKGGGGALFREKMVASLSRRLLIVVDDSKVVSTLGKFPLPVEVVPFGWEITSRNIARLGCSPKLRLHTAGPFITDNGNYILDCYFTEIQHPELLNEQLTKIIGVVETGLFVNMAEMIIVGGNDGVSVKSTPMQSEAANE